MCFIIVFVCCCILVIALKEVAETLRKAVVDLLLERDVTVQLDCNTFCSTSFSFDLLGDVNILCTL